MRASTPVSILLFLLIAGAALTIHAKNVTAGIDFYTFWSIPTAQKVSGGILGNPYANGQPYEDALTKFVTRFSDDNFLFIASAFWKIDPFGNRKNPSPLLYTVFAIFPEDYSRALGLYRWATLLLFLGGMLSLRFLLLESAFTLTVLAAVLVLTFFPLQQDLRVLNVNCFLFASLASLLALTSAIGQRPNQRSVSLRCVISSALVFLTLFKPVVLLPCALLAIHLTARASTRQRIAICASGVVSFATCFLLPSLFFGSWSVWKDWSALVSGGGLLYPLEETGNLSLPMIVARWAESDLVGSTFLVAGLLLASLLVVVVRAIRAGARPNLRMALQRVWQDPPLLVSVGMLLTLATSPLVWSHYYVLALIPALWLLKAPVGARLLPVLSVSFFMANSELVSIAPLSMGFSEYLRAVHASSSLLLWLGTLCYLSAALTTNRDEYSVL